MKHGGAERYWSQFRTRRKTKIAEQKHRQGVSDWRSRSLKHDHVRAIIQGMGALQAKPQVIAGGNMSDKFSRHPVDNLRLRDHPP